MTYIKWTRDEIVPVRTYIFISETNDRIYLKSNTGWEYHFDSRQSNFTLTAYEAEIDLNRFSQILYRKQRR